MIDHHIDWKHELLWTVVFILAVIPVFMDKEIADWIVQILK